MTVAPKLTARAEADRLLTLFEAAGAARIEADVLQPADVLLDLYGEDIRARAYTTSDPLRGEQMLRPDFTVPVVQHHMEVSAEPARYAYAGEVFRRQDTDETRPNEHLQVGFEVFDRSDPIAVEVEVFSLFSSALDGLNLRPVMGDMGLLRAAVAGLNTSAARKAALLRHLWRPERFVDLLTRYSEPRSVSLVETSAPQIGVRRMGEVQARIEALKADAETPPLNAEDVARLTRLLGISGALETAVSEVLALANEMPAIAEAAGNLEARTKALVAAGVDLRTVTFEVAYGRTLMEYYDGFVFGFLAQDQELPPVATGGRYDALTAALGRGQGVPAVGGVIRPELLVTLGGRDA